MGRAIRTMSIVCVAGLVAGAAPAVAVTPAASVTVAAKRHEQTVVKNGQLPRGIQGRGRTLLIEGPMRTSAGQRATVDMTVRTARGRAVPAKQFRFVRRDDGTTWTRAALDTRAVVRVTISAPAKGRYAALRQVYRYEVKPGKPPELGDFGWGSLLELVIKSVAGKGLSELTGWAIGAISGKSSDKDLKPILDKLNEIQQQLGQISKQIQQLQEDLRQANCDIQTSGAATAVSHIQAFNKDLRSMIENQNTNGKDLERWALRATDSDTIRSDLLVLDKILRGQAGSGGSIKACSSALLDKWTKPLDEDTYYSRLWQYMAYFHQAQIVGLNTLVEAYHFMAVERAKESKVPLPAPKDMPNVCTKAFPGYKDAVKDYCSRSFTATQDTYFAMLDQTLLAGAPYAWTPGSMSTDSSGAQSPVIATQRGTNLVWVLDLSKYRWIQDRCGPGPVDSYRKRCQRAMFTSAPDGYWQQYNLSMRLATSPEWAALLQTQNQVGKRVSEVMEAVGFAQGRQDRIISFTGTHEQAGPGATWARWNSLALRPAVTAWCTLDTNFVGRNDFSWPVCSGPDGSRPDILIDQQELTRIGIVAYPAQWVKDQASRYDFYQGMLEHDGDAMVIERAPGWMSENVGKDQPPSFGEYWWPVYQAPTDPAKCTKLSFDDPNKLTVPVPAYNAAGALSMCNENYRTWLFSWFPKQPQRA